MNTTVPTRGSLRGYGEHCLGWEGLFNTTPSHKTTRNVFTEIHPVPNQVSHSSLGGVSRYLEECGGVTSGQSAYTVSMNNQIVKILGFEGHLRSLLKRLNHVGEGERSHRHG